jgi:glycosyltransferase involved in cell wall biosynthesis
MHARPLISVIIIFFNTEKYIEEAIESVLAQTYDHWELLLADDGSNDGSSALARKYAAQDVSRIRYLEHEGHQNLGMSASRNLGIWNARGKYIAFLDADDIWLPEKLETHITILDAHPEVDMLYGGSKYWFSWTGHPNDAGRDYVPELKVKTQTSFPPPTLLPLFLEGRTEIPCPCSVMARTEVIKKVGGFEESFRGMYEDQAFYAKMCLSATILATGDCLAWYRQHPSSNYATAISSGATHVLHYNFLRWLENYCREQNVRDARVWRTLRRQLWLYHDPLYGKFPSLSQNNLRWIKKWMLRVEEHLLPAAIRNRLWMNR